MTGAGDVGRWRRVRWSVRAALTIGVAASVAANVLHAHPNPVAQSIAAWPPLALLLTVELVGRVPVHRRLLGGLRILATTVIAGIAGWVSYGHMAAVAARYGETPTSARLLPVSVDGLIVVASICLVEISSHLARADERGQLVAAVAIVDDDQAGTVVDDQAADAMNAVAPTAPVGPEPTPAASDVDSDRPPAAGRVMFGQVRR